MKEAKFYQADQLEAVAVWYKLEVGGKAKGLGLHASIIVPGVHAVLACLMCVRVVGASRDLNGVVSISETRRKPFCTNKVD